MSFSLSSTIIACIKLSTRETAIQGEVFIVIIIIIIIIITNLPSTDKEAVSHVHYS